MGSRGPGARPKGNRAGADRTLTSDFPWENPDLIRFERVIAFLEWLPVTKGILAGTRMELLPEQREFIERVYGVDKRPVKVGIQSVARGNGKTGLLAGLGMCHLVGPEAEGRGAVYSAAIDRQQAGIMFSEMEAIIFAVPEFDEIVNIRRFHKTLEVLDGPGKGSIYEALSQDARRAHGLAPSLWIYDELAQAKDRELLDNLSTGMGKRKESLGIIISTQAPTDHHPLSLMIDDALSGADPSIYAQLICAPDDADPFAEETLRACNPAVGKFLDLDDLLQQAEQARRMPSFEPRYRNLRLNQRISQEALFIPPVLWNACGAAPLEEAFEAGPIYAGLDLSARNDLTALVYCALYEGQWHVRCEFFAPLEGIRNRAVRDRAPYEQWAKDGYITATPGSSVDYDIVAERLRELADDYDLAAVAFDRWRMDVLEAALARIGVTLPLRPHGQGFKDMAPSLDALEAELINQRIRHGGNPVLKWCASNAIVDSDAAGNRKLNKSKSTGRIDGMQALTMAIGVHQRELTPEPFDVTRALQVISL